MNLYDYSKAKETAEFKAQMYYIEIERLNGIYLQVITEMLLCDKIRIQWLPFELRISNKDFYLSAFRVSRNISKERFIEDMKLLYNDIQNDFPDKERYIEIFNSYIDYYNFADDKNYNKSNISGMRQYQILEELNMIFTELLKGNEIIFLDPEKDYDKNNME